MGVCIFTMPLNITRPKKPKMLNLNSPDFLDRHIVIVDDDAPSVKYYETVLKYTGAEITVLKNGKEFIEFIEAGTKRIDFVIMDYLIPFVTGVDCTRRFRKSDKTTPVVMISAYYSEQTKNDAFVAGCNEYVLKPVLPEKLIMLLEKYLTHKRHLVL
jgi:CheY-like chemotaxis protein